MRLPIVPALLISLSVAGVVLVACGEDSDDGGGPTPTVAEGTPTGAQAQEITVVASDTFAFDPDALTLTAGQPVVLTLDNSGSAVEHDFTSDDLPASDIVAEGAEHESDAELHVAAEAGETGTLQFTPTEAGEYTFYCAVEGHRDAGMEGTITVEPAA